MIYHYLIYSHDYGIFGLFDSNASMIATAKQFEKNGWINKETHEWLNENICKGVYWQLKVLFSTNSPYQGELIFERITLNRLFDPSPNGECLTLWETKQKGKK